MVISILKFLVRTSSFLIPLFCNLKTQDQFKAPPEGELAFRNLIRRLFGLVLIYGLSIEDKQENTFVNRSLLDTRGKLESRLNRFLEEILNQPIDVRISLRNHLLKLLKIISDENFMFLMGLLRESIEDVEPGQQFLVHVNMLDLLRYLIRYHDKQLDNSLDSVVKLILKTIDPNKPDLRPLCQEFATKTLKSILTRCAFSAFHQKTQHYIVSNAKNELVIFDLKMALEWKILKGHRKQITAIAIHSDGKHLASFSLEEERLVIWVIEYQGFFNSFLSGSNKVLKDIKIGLQLKNFKNLLNDGQPHDWSINFVDLNNVIFSEKNRRINIVISL
jgi:hypothetical protein